VPRSRNPGCLFQLCRATSARRRQTRATHRSCLQRDFFTGRRAREWTRRRQHFRGQLLRGHRRGVKLSIGLHSTAENRDWNWRGWKEEIGLSLVGDGGPGLQRNKRVVVTVKITSAPRRFFSSFPAAALRREPPVFLRSRPALLCRSHAPVAWIDNNTPILSECAHQGAFAAAVTSASCAARRVSSRRQHLPAAGEEGGLLALSTGTFGAAGWAPKLVEAWSRLKSVTVRRRDGSDNRGAMGRVVGRSVAWTRFGCCRALRSPGCRSGVPQPRLRLRQAG